MEKTMQAKTSFLSDFDVTQGTTQQYAVIVIIFWERSTAFKTWKIFYLLASLENLIFTS